MNRLLVIPAFALLGACSPPVMIAVDVDEEIEGGKLVLNGKSAGLTKNVDGVYWAKWDGPDASGYIEIRYPDGERIQCRVGYVTHGMEPQRFEVRDRTCSMNASP